jgi:toxin ParE1/3/4
VAYRLSARARRDLDRVIRYSLEKHGRDAAGRYLLLLTTAMDEAGGNPFLQGSRPVIAKPGVRSYAILHSRLRVPKEQRVQSPAHQLVYRCADDGIVEILAIIGDSYPPARLRVRR